MQTLSNVLARNKLLGIILAFVVAVTSIPAQGQQRQQRIWSDAEKPILAQIRQVRSLPDDERSRTTKSLALHIRELPAGANKRDLAIALSHLSTEGDFGHDTLQEVGATLAAALRETPVSSDNQQPAEPYLWLAALNRYEHINATLDDPQFTAANAKLQEEDARKQDADFTLSDTEGKTWNLKSLRGKVVLVNFWATWCPPCRKEMPDLQSLYKKFEKVGFVVLGITDEDTTKVNSFLKGQHVGYPILFDPQHEAAKLFGIEGIPKSFVYDRDGKLVAQAIDMRTQKQFRQMLAEGGLK